MMRTFRQQLILSLRLFSSSCLICSPALAGGPLVIENHAAVKYADPNITLNVENGDLGSRSNAEADALLLQALSLWNSASTSTINLNTDETQINLDINSSNFTDYLPNVNGTTFHSDDNLNPVVYDDDGQIIDAFFGAGQSNNTIGFAASIYTASSNRFLEGYAVISGNFNLSDTRLKLLIAHEIGHFFGLDHSQADIDNQESGALFCDDSRGRNQYPLMYPIACRNDYSLHEDDTSALSALYPSSSFDTTYSTLSGKLTDQSGKAIPGANLWAENVTTGEVFSTVSDYLKQGTGAYKLQLPPGDYTLHANSINTEFNGGSSVGPYADDSDDLSFTCSNEIAPIQYEITPGNAEVISVDLNQTTLVDFSLTGIDIDDCITPAPATQPAPASSKSSGAFSINILLTLLILLQTKMLRHRRPREALINSRFVISTEGRDLKSSR